jgi:hypothetical protein
VLKNKKGLTILMFAKFLIMAIALAFFGPIASRAEDAPAPKTPSMESQRNYLRELAIYQSINAEIQEAQKKLALDQPLLEEQRKKVAAAASAAIASCGDNFTFDQGGLAKGEMVCVALPPKPEAAKPPVPPTTDKAK